MRPITLPARLLLRAGSLVWLLWLAFVLRGFWYCALLPPWEGYDEPFHFAALQNVAGGQGMPHTGAPITLEVQESLHLLPLPWELHFHAMPQPLTPHEEFWKLPASERAQRIQAVRALRPEDGIQPASEPIVNYESQQPPGYYWLLGRALSALSSFSLLSRIYLIRFLSLLLASAAVPLAFWVAKQVLRSELQALGTTAIIVLLPELMINVARVSNESLALVCYTAMLAGAVAAVQKPLLWRAWLLLGVALGCGLLTKAYVLSAVPGVIAVAVAGFASLPSSGERRASVLPLAARLAVTIIVASVISGGWYLRTHRATGSWTGVADDAAMGHMSLAAKLAAVPQVNWKSGFLSIAISHVWFGAWSFLRVPNFVCVMAFVVFAAALLGVAIRFFRHETPAAERRQILVLAIFYLCFWAGLAYEVVVIYLHQGVSASAGWYLYATAAAEVVLLVWGLQAFLPARIVFSSLGLAIAVLDLNGTHALMMPYYSGLTGHAGKWVPSALGPTLVQLPLVFDRLSQLHPAWLGQPLTWSLWAGYCGATIGTVVGIFIFFRKAQIDG